LTSNAEPEQPWSTKAHGVVAAVSARAGHGLGKQNRLFIRLLAGLGVEGDAHCGATVKHRSRLARHAAEPNLRQVHLIHGELHDELRDAGFDVGPGQMGENITTRGLDLLGLSTGARLRLGEMAVIEITGLRTPCVQLDRFQPGLMAATLGRDARGDVVLRAGVMATVIVGGEVRSGDVLRLAPLAGPPKPLRPV